MIPAVVLLAAAALMGALTLAFRAEDRRHERASHYRPSRLYMVGARARDRWQQAARAARRRPTRRALRPTAPPAAFTREDERTLTWVHDLAEQADEDPAPVGMLPAPVDDPGRLYSWQTGEFRRDVLENTLRGAV